PAVPVGWEPRRTERARGTRINLSNAAFSNTNMLVLSVPGRWSSVRQRDMKTAIEGRISDVGSEGLPTRRGGRLPARLRRLVGDHGRRGLWRRCDRYGAPRDRRRRRSALAVRVLPDADRVRRERIDGADGR